MDQSRFKQSTKLETNDSRCGISVYRNLSGNRDKQSDNHRKNNRIKRHDNYKYLYTVIALLFASPVNAETVGGVSATASPVKPLLQPVTQSRAIQVYRVLISLTLMVEELVVKDPLWNFTPYVTGAVSAQKPYEGYYDDPVYDMTDNFGAFDENGLPIGDGRLDNPGDVQFYRPVRTGQKDNYNLSIGFSATWSKPLDKNLQKLCKQAATTQIALQQQLTANKRLDFEIARLKNCGELKSKESIFILSHTILFSMC